MGCQVEDDTKVNCPICLGLGYVTLFNGKYTYDNQKDRCQSCGGSGLFLNWAMEHQEF